MWVVIVFWYNCSFLSASGILLFEVFIMFPLGNKLWVSKSSHKASIFMAKTIMAVGIFVSLLNKEETRESEIFSHFEVVPPVLMAIGYSGWWEGFFCQFNIMQVTYYWSCVHILLINQFITWQVKNVEYWLCIWNKHFLSQLWII